MEQFNLGTGAANEAGVTASTDTEGMVFNLNDVEEQASAFEVLPKFQESDNLLRKAVHKFAAERP